MYVYLVYLPKSFELRKLVDVMDIKDPNMLRNIKTHWISLLESLRKIMNKYKTMICKMAKDAVVKYSHLTKKQRSPKETTRYNLDLLCNVGTLLALTCLGICQFSHEICSD
jgi:hypothetical protein